MLKHRLARVLPSLRWGFHHCAGAVDGHTYTYHHTDYRPLRLFQQEGAALPHNGDVPSVSTHQLKPYPEAAEKIIVFDKYQDVSAKDQVPIDYELSITSPLEKRDAIMKVRHDDDIDYDVSTFFFNQLTMNQI